MLTHPSIYEINTRVWLRRFDQPGRRGRLTDVPAAYWDLLAEQGFDYVWLMGLWETVDAAVGLFCLEEGLQRAYSAALNDWRREDVIGSPYAIEDYHLNPAIATREELLAVRRQLNERGMGLVLDFIPNHFHAHSSLVERRPELFVTGVKQDLLRDPHTFFRSNGKVFAHGKDPYFPAWKDTVQVNYFLPAARALMQERLLGMPELCDGLRCDMAILPLNDVLVNTWGHVAEAAGWRRPEEEFWEVAIGALKEKAKDFILIAEAYWDREWYLQRLGFDFTYDKKLTDRLLAGGAGAVRDHLRAELSYQEHSVRFLENHDEERALRAFGDERSRAAAVITATVPGMRFYHQGQLEGRRIRLPVQLGREPVEPCCPCPIGPALPLESTMGGRKGRGLLDGPAALRPVCRCSYVFYDQLLRLTREEVFKKGAWRLLTPQRSRHDGTSYQHLLAWEWRYREERRLVVVNYSSGPAAGRIPITDLPAVGHLTLTDLLNRQMVRLPAEELRTEGLPVALPAYRSHVFAFV